MPGSPRRTRSARRFSSGSTGRSGRPWPGDLNIVLNVHHYDELNDAPRGQRPRFLGLWRQIAARYASWPGRLYFELLNEPRAAMTARAWNELIPLEFTHQGAPWRAGAGQWLGTTWGDDAGLRAVGEDLARAASWAAGHGRPLFIGEFGSYEQAGLAAGQRWTRFVRREAERLGMSCVTGTSAPTSARSTRGATPGASHFETCFSATEIPLVAP
jgi:Cellulase (glycosyl hydrolase family 5)